VRATDVALPGGCTFVIANSLAVSNKAESAPRHYNLRVVECRLAAQVMARAMGADAGTAADVRTLRDLEPLIEARYGPGGEEAAVSALLRAGAYSQEEVEGLLGWPLERQYAGQPAPLLVLSVARGSGFRLRDRALHVYGEAKRVLQFGAVCNEAAAASAGGGRNRGASGGGGGGAALPRLAALMDASHASCRDLYDCSCPELEELVTCAKASGALGARLTGAGWGGCVVALLLEADAPTFMRQLRTRYFAKLIAAGRIGAEQLAEVLFESKPSSGAAVLRLGQAA
jgi:N-acetylgalactosamine kinase